MKIKNKINLSFLAVFLIVLGFFIYIVFGVFSGELRKEVEAHLESTAMSRSNHVVSYLLNQKEDVKIFSQLELIETVLSADEKMTGYDELIDDARRRLTTINQENSEYYEVFLVDRHGKIIVSTDPEQVGKDKSQDPYYLKPKEVGQPFLKDIYFSDSVGKITMTASAPVYHDGTNEFLGVFVSRINKDELFKILTNKDGISVSGQTYLVNEDFRLLSPDIYASNIFEQKVDTENSRNCFRMAEMAGSQMKFSNVDESHGAHFDSGHKSVESFKNYQGTDVLGTHIFIPEINWCLLSEVEQTEALASNRKLIIYLAGLSTSALIIYLILSMIISRLITNPIEQLRRGTEIIKKGDYNYKVGMERNDEIGELSKSFDKMVLGIRKARAEVDKKVEQQTRELKKQADHLIDQRKAVLNVLDDVDEEKEKTEREKDKIDAILHSIGDAVFVVNKEMKIVMFNKIAEEISGYSVKESIGKNYKDVLRFVFEEDEKVNDEFIVKAMKTGKIKEMANHTMLITKEGRKIPVADSASPLRDRKGEIKGCVVVFRDVTEEREIDKAKTEFVSLASHQLRTPLSSVNWYTEMLLNGDAGKINEEQKEFLKEIYKGNQRMVDLVNALLNVSRLELGTFIVEPEKVDVKKLAKDIINELNQKINKKDQKLKQVYKGSLDDYKGDPKLLAIIFQNFLSNATKYTPEKGKIELEISRDDKFLKIKVADNGMGIPSGQQKEIFSKLFRADNVRETDTQGTGLGLYIIKLIVDHCGGKIWFESKENKGTKFYVTLPSSGMRKRTGTKKLS